MQVVCEMMRLRPECVQEYVALHGHTWPELVRRHPGERLPRGVHLPARHPGDRDHEMPGLPAVRAASWPAAVFQKWTTRVRAMLVSDEALFGTRDPLVDLYPIWNLADFPPAEEP